MQVMDEGQTTAAIQHHLDELGAAAESSAARPIISTLLGRAVRRLHRICAGVLHRSYARLTWPPLGLETDELLSAIVERLLKALREARPTTVRAFFALANQHIRWELNDLTRRLDAQATLPNIHEDGIAAPPSSGSDLGTEARRILAAIEALPEEEKEALSLVRIQELTHSEAAEILGVSVKTIQRRLNRAVLLLAESLGDIRPDSPEAGGS
jgi:RNA polymerase sigma-70 factor (ECF subfamily)